MLLSTQMTLDPNSRHPGPARAVASLGAALVLLAQLIGAVHFHEGVRPPARATAAAPSSDRGQCPVCQLAFHSPGSIASAPAISVGVPLDQAVVLTESTARPSAVFSPERGRAPPVSL